MITVQQAAEAALKFLTTVEPNPYEVKIEEVECEPEKNFWFITLGYSEGNLMPYNLRKYKIFKVDAGSGQVVSMKIRQLE